MSKFIHITCLDNEHVAIGYEGWNYTTEQPYNLTVVNFKKIIEDKPLDAQIWQGKIHPDFSEAVFCGLINDDNTLYYCIGQDRYGGKNLLGKARWNGSGFNILESRILEPGGTLNLGMTHLIADLSDEYFVMAGCSYSEASSYTLQPFAVRVQKSDLSTVQPALLIGEDRAFMPLVLNIAPYSKANDETDCIMLFLGSEEYGSPYILTHILW